VAQSAAQKRQLAVPRKGNDLGVLGFKVRVRHRRGKKGGNMAPDDAVTMSVRKLGPKKHERRSPSGGAIKKFFKGNWMEGKEKDKGSDFFNRGGERKIR